MHCHTFFSFNAYGYSPTALAWLAKRRGLRAVGIVDFDVLDGVDEFLAACDVAGVRGSAGIETRVFIPEFATREINSPGEPGIYYDMGIGFTSSHAPDPSGFQKPEGSPAAILASMRARAGRRNRDMVSRINAHLAPVTVGYERDVLPLTPAGNATERHMLAAYIRAAEVAGSVGPKGRATGDRPEQQVVDFWAAKLGLPADQVAANIGDYAKFSNLVRAKLMKKGGVGYVHPSPEAFPTVEEFHSFIVACGALPCATWLDGLSAGEQAIHELLELLIGKGVVALNVIPDRNWNIPHPELRRLKVGKLHEIVRIAGEYDLPLNIGTEMNAPGNKLVDDFAAPELAPVRQALLDGAHFIYGHTVMSRIPASRRSPSGGGQRGLGLGYQSAWAKACLPTRRARNAFYTQIGYRVPPGPAGLAWLRGLDPTLPPAGILAHI
jgi:hypothetical protein